MIYKPITINEKKNLYFIEFKQQEQQKIKTINN